MNNPVPNNNDVKIELIKMVKDLGLEGLKILNRIISDNKNNNQE